MSDRFETFKGDVQAQNEYREAYAALAAKDPAAALGLPHPDAFDLDPVEAMEAIRRVEGRLKADPKLDIKARG